MVGVDDRLHQLLDGEFSPDEIAEDPMLSSLAERIYGVDAAKEVAKAKRQKEESVEELDSKEPIETDEGGELDLFVEIVEPKLEVTDVTVTADDELPTIAPTDLPPIPSPSESPPLCRKASKKLRLFGLLAMGTGVVGVLVVLFNTIFGLGRFMGGCVDNPDCTADQLKLNWLNVGTLDKGWSWSVVGDWGFPDLAFLVLFGLLIWYGFWLKGLTKNPST